MLVAPESALEKMEAATFAAVVVALVEPPLNEYETTVTWPTTVLAMLVIKMTAADILFFMGSYRTVGGSGRATGRG